MSELYVLASIPGQGKTTTSVLLEKKLRESGYSVACLQTSKGQYDVHAYLSENCFHYSIPLEAAKSKAEFEKWVPVGYDAYILEVTFPYSPVGIAYVHNFENVNELISYDLQDNWKDYVCQYEKNHWDPLQSQPDYDVSSLFNQFHARNVQQVITKTPVVLNTPCVGTDKTIYNMDQFAVESIHPKMVLPLSEKKCIAVGAFPGEYWDIFPRMRWYESDYASFKHDFRENAFDVAIIGDSLNENLKFHERAKDGIVICYQPSVYGNFSRRHDLLPCPADIPAILSRIKSQPVGTPISDRGDAFSGYNNRFWVWNKYPDHDPLWTEENIIFCSGWILPQYLINEGLLEVN